MIDTQRPISAYSMSDFENLNSAEFKRGKDKTKRKSRKGMIAAGVGGGLAAAGAVGAGVRYGLPEMKKRKAMKNFDAKGVIASKGGAKGQFDRDVESIKKAPGKAKASGERAFKALTTKTGVGNTNKGLLKEAGSRIGNVFKSGKVGKAGVVGAGLLGAGAVAGGGYAAYKAMKNRKKK